MLPLAIEESTSALPAPPERSWQVWLDPSREACAYASQAGAHYWIDVSNVAMFHYSDVTALVRAVTQAAISEERVRAAYHRIVLPFLLQALGYEMLHASAVQTDSGVVALCGESVAGKSTIAVGLGRRGYPVWADDALLLEAGARIRAIALPFDVRLRRASAAFFGMDCRRDDSPGDGSGFEREPVDLVAVCVLRRSAGLGNGEIAECPAGAPALTTLLAHACAFNLSDLDRKREMVAHYLAIATRVPVFEVGVEPGLERLPGLLDQLEARVIHPEPAWGD